MAKRKYKGQTSPRVMVEMVMETDDSVTIYRQVKGTDYIECHPFINRLAAARMLRSMIKFGNVEKTICDAS